MSVLIFILLMLVLGYGIKLYIDYHSIKSTLSSLKEEQARLLNKHNNTDIKINFLKDDIEAIKSREGKRQ